jgi:hypothetical protein
MVYNITFSYQTINILKYRILIKEHNNFRSVFVFGRIYQ